MYAVIMAGGRGTRFWPRSREKAPKHLLDIISQETILRETVARLSPLIPPHKIFIVTGHGHAGEVRRQTRELPQENIIVEPEGKNTAPCIGLAAVHLKSKDPGSSMVVLPSDHFIADPGEFRRILDIGGQAARRGEYIVTVGVTPTCPSTGYGYLEKGEKECAIDHEAVYRVRSVREKPEQAEACRLLGQGNFLWNSGIFIGTVATFMNAFACWLPDLSRQLLGLEQALGKKREKAAVNEAYKTMAPVSFDYGVMEKAGNILVIPGNFGWSDVGTWDALWEVLAKDEKDNSPTAGSVVLNRNSRNSLIHSPRKLVALIGVEDLIVVDTKDALLICRKGLSQEVKHIVELLEQRGWKEYL